MTFKDSDCLYTIKEFAMKLKVHPNTVRRAIKSGKISAINLGDGINKIYRIPYDEIGRMAKFDLDEYIKRMKEK